MKFRHIAVIFANSPDRFEMSILSYSLLLLFVLWLCSAQSSIEFENMSVLIERFKRDWPVEEWKRHGFFRDEYILDINEHWLRFVPPNGSSFYLLGMGYLVITMTGVVGNVLVIFLFLRCRCLRTPANYLIANLAISDCIMSAKSPIVSYNCFYKGPVLGDTACQIYGFLGGLTGTISIMTLSVISFDRYFVIKFPLSSRQSNVRIKTLLTITWLYGAIFAAIPALNLGFGRYRYEGYLTSCSFDYLTDDDRIRWFILVFFGAAWIVPFVVISFSYGNILYVVATRNTENKRGRDSFRHVKGEKNKKQEITIAKIAFCTILLWFLSWTPYAVVALLGIFKQKQLITPVTSMFPALFCKTAACVNSYVYALSHPKFKTELKKLCLKQTREKNKVWMSKPAPFKRNRPSGHCRASITFDHQASSLEEVDEEVVEMSIGQISSTVMSRSTNDFVPTMQTDNKEGTNVIELLCMRPSFRNKPSSFRRLARRWSTKEKKNLADEEK